MRRILCPSCDHPIEVRQEERLIDAAETLEVMTSIECPNCGLVPLKPDPGRTVAQTLGTQGAMRVAHFSLIRRLGQGGFGEVWLARDVNLERDVALKLPAPSGRDTANLLHEAQTAASLRHPNIVSIYEVSTDVGQAFIASEFIDGLTLQDLLSTGKPTLARAVELMIPVARALHYAHQHGVVHRDVKPANIILNKEGQPFVTDFGIAKRISADTTISSEGQVIGTARYMSPEQATGKTRETDHRTDVYAMGVVLFQMLTGHLPFRGNMRAILHQKTFEDAPSPRTLNHTLPRDLETICVRCLERDPARRYESAAEVANELERFKAGEPIKARPVSTLERTWRWCRRRPAVAGLLAGLFLSLSGGLIGVSAFWMRSEQHADATRRALYRSQMNLVAMHLERGHVAGVRQTLARIAEDPLLQDLRGFEWHYFQGQIEPIQGVGNHSSVVTAIAVSADGTLCASCGQDRSLCVWRVKTPQPIRTITLDPGRFQAADFSAIGNRLVTGSSDGFVRIWDPLHEGPPITEVKHGPGVMLVRVSPDGRRALSAGESGAVRIWDLVDGSLHAEIAAGKSGTKDARFSPDGTRIAVATRDELVRIWEIETKVMQKVLEPNPLIECLAWSDDGKSIVTASYNGALRIWSTDGTPQHSHESLWGRIDDLEFIHDTPLIAILAYDGRLHVFDTQKQQEIRALSTYSLTTGVMARSANGETLIIGSGDGSVAIMNVHGIATPSILWHKAAVRAVEFLPNRQRMLAVSEDGDVRLWNTDDGESARIEGLSGRSRTAVAVHPDGNLVAVGSEMPSVTIWDLNANEAAQDLHVSAYGASHVRFAPSGTSLAVVTRRGPVLLYRVGEWKEPVFRGGERESRVMEATFLGSSLALAYEDGVVALLDSATGAKRQEFKVSGVPSALTACESGTVLAVGTTMGEIHLWETSTQSIRKVIQGHTGPINALTPLPNSMTLVSGGRDKDLKFWDTPSGELITILSGHTRQVFAIDGGIDGQSLASGGLEGDIRIWRSTREAIGAKLHQGP